MDWLFVLNWQSDDQNWFGLVWFLGCSRTDNYILSQEDKAEPNYISVDEALRMIQDKYKNAYLDYQFTFDYISNFYEKESYLGYFVRDIETTGFSSLTCQIIEIGDEIKQQVLHVQYHLNY